MSKIIYYHQFRRSINIDPLADLYNDTIFNDEDLDIEITSSKIEEELKELGKLNYQFYKIITSNSLLFSQKIKTFELNLPNCRVLNYLSKNLELHNQRNGRVILPKIYKKINHQIFLFLIGDTKNIKKEISDCFHYYTYIEPKITSVLDEYGNFKLKIESEEEARLAYHEKTKKFIINEKIDFSDFKNISELEKHLKNIQITSVDDKN